MASAVIFCLIVIPTRLSNEGSGSSNFAYTPPFAHLKSTGEEVPILAAMVEAQDYNSSFSSFELLSIPYDVNWRLSNNSTIEDKDLQMQKCSCSWIL